MIQDHCPLKKEKPFPCPRCCYSYSITERRKYLNATTWWLCKYPDIVNLSMLTVEDIKEEQKGA